MSISEKYVTNDLIASILPSRSVSSRKGQNGTVAIIGGSRHYHGAPILSAAAAMRAGSDLVYLMVPKVISIPVRSFSPNFIVIPLPDDKLTLGCANKIMKWLPDVDSVVLGCGLGIQKTDGLKKLIVDLSSQDINIVLDAGALRQDVIKKISQDNCVLTPHAGEFKRIFGFEPNSNMDTRINDVRTKSNELGCTILLKGSHDIISNGTDCFINKTGNSSMTVGGTGDILSGLIASFLSKSMSSFNSAIAGAYINGLAGEMVTSKLGYHIFPTDIIDELPFILKSFDKYCD